MKITSTEEYGLRCLLRVAKAEKESPVSAQEIAQQEGLSVPYVQKLMRPLVSCKIVTATRGSRGGYKVGKPLQEISLSQVFEALDGWLEPKSICERHTGERAQCCHEDSCSIRPVWEQLSGFLYQVFDALTLDVLVGDESSVDQALSTMLPKRIEMPSLVSAPSFEQKFDCPLGPG